VPIAWRIFVIVEAVAVACWLTWPLMPNASAIGPALWGTQLLLLMPGSVISGLAVERSLWMTGASLQLMSITALVLAIAINAAIWWGLVAMFRKVRGRARP
jgi:hypothetical protein